MSRKVLISLDSSSLAHDILPCIQPLLSATATEVLLVSNVKEADAAERQQYLDQVQGYLAGMQVQTQLLHGPVAESIVQAATHWGANLIAMSTHGRTGLARALLGSVADQVLHLATQPVFLARAGASATSHLKRLLIPLDGSPLAEAVLPSAHSIAQETGATLTLLLILEELNTWEWGELMHEGRLTGTWKADLAVAAQGYLDGVKARLPDVVCKAVLAPGPVAQMILCVADEEKSDLLIMNTHGRSGYQRWRHGSVTSQVLHEAKVPLLLVRAQSMPLLNPSQLTSAQCTGLSSHGDLHYGHPKEDAPVH